MGKLGRLLLIAVLSVSVAYGQKVKLFDLSKHKLESKSKTKAETYKIGDVTIKTDFQYVQAKTPYHQGTKFDVEMANFEDVIIVVRKNISCSGWDSIEFFDDFGESLKIPFDCEKIKFLSRNYETGSQPSTIKLKIRKKVLHVYSRNGEIIKISMKDMDNVVKFRLNTDNNNGHQYHNIIIIGQN